MRHLVFRLFVIIFKRIYQMAMLDSPFDSNNIEELKSKIKKGLYIPV